MADQTFTSGQILTAAQMTDLQTNIGLTFVLAQTIGSAVSSVTVSSAFSSTFDKYNPNLAKYTYFSGALGYNTTNGNSRSGLTGVLKDTTQYTAFTLTPSAGTLTGGTIRVYGYRNS
jgi:hypothetical protein